MLIEEIVEDKRKFGAEEDLRMESQKPPSSYLASLWTERSSSWQSINWVSYQGNRVQGVNGAFFLAPEYHLGRRFK